jgi:hypothetical protein
MAMRIQTVDSRNFEPINAQQAAIHTLGKVLFLPLDVIIGLIVKDDDSAQEDNEIRVTQNFAKTSVVKTH